MFLLFKLKLADALPGTQSFPSPFLGPGQL